MAGRKKSAPIPERWELVTERQPDGSKLTYYLCSDTGQQFYKYKDLIRYVNYAEGAKLSIYSPDFTKERKRNVVLPQASKPVEAENCTKTPIDESKRTKLVSPSTDEKQFQLGQCAKASGNQSELGDLIHPSSGGKQSELGQCTKTSDSPSEFLDLIISSLGGEQSELGESFKAYVDESKVLEHLSSLGDKWFEIGENEFCKKTGSGGKDSIMPEDNSGKEEEFISVHDFDCLPPIGTIELVIPQSEREKGKMKIGTGDKSGKSSEQAAKPKCDSKIKSSGKNSSLRIKKFGKKQWKSLGKKPGEKS